MEPQIFDGSSGLIMFLDLRDLGIGKYVCVLTEIRNQSELKMEIKNKNEINYNLTFLNVK